ncbi:MAG: hypothetical protein K9I80_13075 [Ignavibacteriales bacterium]|nr:hypothetical protein [Candidatus Cloacimonadota bacterium]MCF8307358.1 hypothetical protein [Ignavibacteriales bacterium]
MIWNYFKIAFRYLYRQNGYSISNIPGLAIGISCTILLSLWIPGDLSYGNFLDSKDQIFSVLEHQEYSSPSLEAAVTPGLLAAVSKMPKDAISIPIEALIFEKR